MPFGLVVPTIAALLGGVFIFLGQLITDRLARSPRGKEFLASSLATSLLNFWGLHDPTATPGNLFKALDEASKQMDEVVAKIQEYTKGRAQSVTALEQQLGLLTVQETELKKRIDALQQVPLPAAEYLAAVVKKDQKTGVVRDYILFIAGVVVSAIVTIILKHFNLA